MKKAVIAILALLYMTIASGVVVNVHYCMGRIASVEYGYNDHDHCGKCGMTSKQSNCCHTEYKLVKLDDAHRLVEAQVAVMALPAELPAYTSLFPPPPAGEEHYFARQYHSPPDVRSNEVYLHNCVFRI